MENTDSNNTNKVQVGAKIDPELLGILERFRIEEDRSMSNMIERLLKESPRVKEALGAETVGAGA